MVKFINWFTAIVLLAVFFPSTLNAAQVSFYDGDVFIIIEKSLYPHLDTDNLQSWLQQLDSEAWRTKVLKPETDETLTANRLKEYMVGQDVYLHPEYLRTRRKGVILIGNFPHTHINLNKNNDLKSDLWYMDIHNGARLIFNRFVQPSTINVNAGFSFDPLSMWVSRIEYKPEASVQEAAMHINDYLKKNVDCRSTGFASPDCLSENQVTNKNFWESKALISTSVSNKIAGEAFLDSFADAQKNWKKWQDYIFNEDWDHCSSFLNDMYRIYNRTHSTLATAAAPAGIPPLDKIALYGFGLPVFGLGVLVSTLYGWRYPSSQKYLGAAWATLLALSLVPQYKCPDKNYTHKRHYLPILFGDGTLRKF